VKPGDTITPSGVITSTQVTSKSRWATLDVKVVNQRGETVAVGEAMVEFPAFA
jgi:acyl dehydratase